MLTWAETLSQKWEEVTLERKEEMKKKGDSGWISWWFSGSRKNGVNS